MRSAPSGGGDSPSACSARWGRRRQAGSTPTRSTTRSEGAGALGLLALLVYLGLRRLDEFPRQVLKAPILLRVRRLCSPRAVLGFRLVCGRLDNDDLIGHVALLWF